MVSNKAQKAIAAALTGVMTLGAAAPAFAITDLGNNWWRVDGKHSERYDMLGASGGTVFGRNSVEGVDRYDTMFDAITVNAEAGYWKDGLADVILVSGESYADTLSSSALAGGYDAPIITTPKDSLGIQAERAIRYFAGQSNDRDADGNPLLRVYIVGGSSSVSDKVLKKVDAIDKAQDDTTKVEVQVVRLWGNTRQDTSVRVMEYLNEYAKGGFYPHAIFVANGDKWMDALSVSSFSYVFEYPIILTNADGSLTAEQIDYLHDALDNNVRVNVIGGSASAAYDALKSIDQPIGLLQYLAGDDRYDTSKLVVDNFFAMMTPTVGTVPTVPLAVATGENWPDALVGGAFIGAQNGVLVLSGEYGKSGKNWNAAVKAAINNNRFIPDYDPLKYILGGKNTISDQTATMLTNI